MELSSREKDPPTFLKNLIDKFVFHEILKLKGRRKKKKKWKRGTETDKFKERGNRVTLK